MSNLDDFWFAQGPLIHGPDQGSIDIGDLLGEAKTDASAANLVRRHNATVNALIAAARLLQELLAWHDGLEPDKDWVLPPIETWESIRATLTGEGAPR